MLQCRLDIVWPSLTLITHQDMHAPHSITEPPSLWWYYWWHLPCCSILILSTPEAKPEKPAWYENILQITNLLQGKWVYKNVLLIPFNKMWALAQGGCWTEQIHDQHMIYLTFNLAKLHGWNYCETWDKAIWLSGCMWYKNKHGFMMNVRSLLIKNH